MKITYPEKSVIFNDLHIPFESKKSFDCLLQFLKWFQPNKIFALGDMIDNTVLSKYDTDNNVKNDAQTQIDLLVGMFKLLSYYFKISE